MYSIHECLYIAHIWFIAISYHKSYRTRALRGEKFKVCISIRIINVQICCVFVSIEFQVQTTPKLLSLYYIPVIIVRLSLMIFQCENAGEFSV